MGNYDFKFELQENDTNTYIAQKITEGAIVLEFGPANGRLTKHLSEEKECIVDIVEIDEDAGREAKRYARHACLGSKDGDIEKRLWYTRYQNERYDYIIIADVLEHLRDPEGLLVMCKDLLKEDGSMLISVPNIAHNTIIAQLFQDRFDYHDTGLLDCTHISFFTPNTMQEMLRRIGFYIWDETFVIHDLNSTEFGDVKNSLDEVEYISLLQHKTGKIYEMVYQIGKCEGFNIINWVHSTCNGDISHFAKIFWAEKKELFAEEKSCVIPIDEKDVEINFTIPAGEKCVRISLTNIGCVITGLCIEIDGNILQNERDFVTNGMKLSEREFLFLNDDSQILIEDIEAGKMKIRYQINDLYKKKNDIYNGINFLNVQCNALREQNNTTLSECNALREQNNTTLSECNALREQNEIILSECNTLREQNNRLSSNYKFLEEQHEECIKFLEEYDEILIARILRKIRRKLKRNNSHA